MTVELSRKDVVLNTLRSEILTGALYPGYPIKDMELSSRLKVSITPVRAAISQLIDEGLIESLPNKRRRVTALSLDRAIELMDTFGVLLCGALYRAAPRFGPEDLGELEDAADRYRYCSCARDAPSARVQFDRIIRLIGHGSGNGELATLVDAVATRSYRLMSLEESSVLWEVWSDSLSATVDLLNEGKGVHAVKRLEKHFRTVLSAMAAGDAGVVLAPEERLLSP